jgi:hypothetical protein
MVNFLPPGKKKWKPTWNPAQIAGPLLPDTAGLGKIPVNWIRE